jgi:hypothetical protein
MAENISNKDMSNDDLYKILKSAESDASWTLGQLIEYQRRGSRAFDYDKKLVSGLNAYIETQNQKFAEILQPYKDEMAKALSAPLSQSAKHVLDNFAAQNAKFAALIPKVQVPKFDFSRDALKDIAKFEPQVIEKPLSSPQVQKVIVEGLNEMSNSHGGFLETIAENTKWDWRQWALFALAAIAAAASVISLFR